ncbi:MAG: MFS transporter [Actinomycetota bacterium]
MTRWLSEARSLALDITPLRHSPGFRALWFGQVVSLVGTQMRYVAVLWQVFELTRSNFAVGLIGLIELVPLIVFSFVGGALADRHDRRRLTAGADIGLLVTVLALMGVSLGSDPSVLWVYVIVALASALEAIEQPARTAMVPALVAPAQLPSAIALRQVGFQVTQIVGPALGGILIASFSVAWVYAIDAATFVAALIALRWIPATIPERTDAASGLESVRQGTRFVLRTPLILSIFLVDIVAMVFGMPRAVFPALAERTFRMGATGLGLLYAAPAMGALVGALTTGWVPRVRRQGVGVLVAVGVWGACITLAGLSLGSLIATLVWLALAGAADVFSAIFRGTMLQEASPDGLRGRVSAVNLMVVRGGPRLGDVEAGAVASLIGAPGSVIFGGLACLLGTGVVAARFGSLRRYTRPTIVTSAAPGQAEDG